MTAWIKVYNSMPSHPKIVLAGGHAAWLFVCGCCYSNEHLTDGFIARHVLPIAAPGVKNAEQLARSLVGAGLWHEVDGGWRIHDYEEHQRTSDQIRVQRAKDAKRKADTRNVSARTPRGQITDSTGSPSGVLGVEVEVEREEEQKRQTPLSTRRADVLECFAYWQEKCNHQTAKPSKDRLSKIEARLRDGYTVADIRQAIDGAARGAFVNDKGKRFDDIELICRAGSKLEDFMGRMNVTPLRNGDLGGRTTDPQVEAAYATLVKRRRAELEAEFAS